MAKIGTSPPADRFAGIMGGPRFVYRFDTQDGTPVDGTNASLRELSPFQLRMVIPDALIEASYDPTGSGVGSVDFITSAALGADKSALADKLAKADSTQSVVATGTQAQLEQFVAQGREGTSGDAAFQPGITDALTAADIALQFQLILNAEPLVLLVNPTEMSITYTKIQSYQSRTRVGYVFEAWGEDQPTISFSGTTAGFVAGSIGQPPSLNAVITETNGISGYQAAARRDSAAWQNFANLYQFYRSNGYIYDTIGKSEAHLFIGQVAIDYDQVTYVGHIENFSFSFDAEMPHRVEFSMEFKVSRMYDSAKASTNVAKQSSSPTAVSSSAADSDGVMMAGEPTVEQSTTPLDDYDGSMLA